MRRKNLKEVIVKNLILMILILGLTALYAGGVKEIDARDSVYTIIALDTIVASDSIRTKNLHMHTWNQRGYYNLFYRIRSLHGNVKVRLMVEETFDTLWGYYNRTTIDSCLAAESTLTKCEQFLIGAPWARYQFNGFGSAGDSSSVLLQFQPIAK